MSSSENTSTGKKWTARVLRKLPSEQRNAILEAAAAEAENDYRNDPDLTGFDAFGENDLHGESFSTQTRRNLAD